MFPWEIVDRQPPGEQVSAHITIFDLGLGNDERVDHHLHRVTSRLLGHLTDLEALRGECAFVIWIRYRFPATEGAANLSPALLSRLSLLQVELVFHLQDF